MKPEARMPKSERTLNSEARFISAGPLFRLRISVFGFLSDPGFRISDLSK